MSWGGGWGNHTPAYAERVAKAFFEGKAFKRHDAESDGERYWLNGNPIARKTEIPLRMAYVLEHNGADFPFVDWGELQISFAGWPTKMTARHLSVLGVKAECWGLNNPMCLINGRLVTSSGWYTLADIEALPVWRPPEPKPRTRFVNLTLPLFA